MEFWEIEKERCVAGWGEFRVGCGSAEDLAEYKFVLCLWISENENRHIFYGGKGPRGRTQDPFGKHSLKQVQIACRRLRIILAAWTSIKPQKTLQFQIPFFYCIARMGSTQVAASQ